MEPNTTGSQYDEAALNDLAVRVLRLRTPLDPSPSRPQLLVGQLPSTWPAAIPLLEDVRVVGSLVHRADALEIVLETQLSPEQVFTWYFDHLLSAGWQPFERVRDGQDPQPPPRGFVTTPTTGQGTQAIYCQGPGGASLTIRTVVGRDGPTEILLFLESGPSSACARASRQRWEQRQRTGALYDLLPTLEAPPGARQKSYGDGFSSEYAYTSALLQTDADLLTLALHYRRQLEQAGWTRTGEGQSGPLVWQTWSFQDEAHQPWNGQFFFAQSTRQGAAPLPLPASGLGERPGISAARPRWALEFSSSARASSPRAARGRRFTRSSLQAGGEPGA
jgi:hypothetical protein